MCEWDKEIEGGEGERIRWLVCDRIVEHKVIGKRVKFDNRIVVLLCLNIQKIACSDQ